jgi:gamma-glutamyl-gamma-aminobutyrate hydrolase PuuD
MIHPAVVVVTRRTTRKNKYIDYVGEYHLELLIRMRIFPQMVPVVEGTPSLLPQYMQGMKGLLLVEGEDVEPKRYKPPAASLQYLEKTHPLKDEIEIRLIRHAMRNRLPILGICRGSQLINVVCGGTLYVDVQKEKKSHVPHIDYHNYDTYRHPVFLVPRTPLAAWYGEETIRVNSYHHQGIRELAPRFRPMAHAKDGLIEAYYDPKADFLVGLQFHPERMLPEYPGNLRVWKAFGRAVHSAAGRRRPNR